MNAFESGATMVDAIALSSPSGHMSKRARKAATKRLAVALFGDYKPTPRPVESKRDSLLRQARTLRELAARGMYKRSYPKEAARLEALAALEGSV